MALLTLPIPGTTPPVTETIYCDAGRTDSYVADGSILKPYRAVTDALSIATTKAVCIKLAPGSYTTTAADTFVDNVAIIGSGRANTTLVIADPFFLTTADFFSIEDLTVDSLMDGGNAIVIGGDQNHFKNLALKANTVEPAGETFLIYQDGGTARSGMLFENIVITMNNFSNQRFCNLGAGASTPTEMRMINVIMNSAHSTSTSFVWGVNAQFAGCKFRGAWTMFNTDSIYSACDFTDVTLSFGVSFSNTVFDSCVFNILTITRGTTTVTDSTVLGALTISSVGTNALVSGCRITGAVSIEGADSVFSNNQLASTLTLAAAGDRCVVTGNYIVGNVDNENLCLGSVISGNWIEGSLTILGQFNTVGTNHVDGGIIAGATAGSSNFNGNFTGGGSTITTHADSTKNIFIGNQTGVAIVDNATDLSSLPATITDLNIEY